MIRQNDGNTEESNIVSGFSKLKTRMELEKKNIPDISVTSLSVTKLEKEVSNITFLQTSI